MFWLVTAGIIILIAGALLLFSGELVNRLSRFFSTTLFTIDDKISRYRIPAGIVLAVAGAWLVWVASAYVPLRYFYWIGVLALLCGGLYLLFPNWLKLLSRIADRLLFSTDEAVIGYRRTSGVILLLVSFYIFYEAARIK